MYSLERYIGRTVELSDSAQQNVARGTALLAYQELKLVCKQACRVAAGGSDAEIVASLTSVADGFTPAVSLGAYRPRFHSGDSLLVDLSRGPLEEFLLLTYLLAEVGRDFVHADWMRNVIREGVSRKVVSSEMLSRIGTV